MHFWKLYSFSFCIFGLFIFKTAVIVNHYETNCCKPRATSTFRNTMKITITHLKANTWQQQPPVTDPNKSHIQDLKFSQWCCWTFRSSGMLHCVVGTSRSLCFGGSLTFMFRVKHSNKNILYIMWSNSFWPNLIGLNNNTYLLINAVLITIVSLGFTQQAQWHHSKHCVMCII